MKPVVDAQVTTLPPRRVTNTLAPNVSRPGMLEDDVDVAAAAQLADALAEPQVLPRVLLPALGIPEAVVLVGAVDDPLGARVAALLRLGLARDDAHGIAAAGQHVLQREAAEPAARAPDQHDVALAACCAPFGETSMR